FSVLSIPHYCLHSFPTRRSSDLFNQFGAFGGGPVATCPPQCNLTVSFTLATALGPDANEVFFNNPLSFENLICVRAERGRQSERDRKSTRLNSSHLLISYAVFCL